MVIEDETLLLQAITKKLLLNDIEVISCVRGKQAFDYLENIKRLPDAIWLDYYLGDMNGLDFVRALQKNSKWSQIPVVVVSNSASSQKVEAMKKLGVKRYLLKADYRLDEIVNIMKSYL